MKSLEIYNKTGIPEWGPPIDELNMDDIITYVRPNTKMSAKWSEVPTDIKDTFEKLGIPQAERDSLAGVGAQYDSELVYHNVKKEVAEQGVIYTDLESAMHGPYAEMIRTHFMHLVPPTVTNLPPCTARYGLAVLLCMFRRMCMWRFPCSPISA